MYCQIYSTPLRCSNKFDTTSEHFAFPFSNHKVSKAIILVYAINH